MTDLVILTPAESKRFDVPPIFSKEERTHYFAIDHATRQQLNQLRSPMNKIGFLLQLGYFRATAKFYVPNDFRLKDIRYVRTALSIHADVDIEQYPSTVLWEHRRRIADMLDWRTYDDATRKQLIAHSALHAERQAKPIQIFWLLIDYCWKQRIEVPSYLELQTLITTRFNEFESEKCEKLSALLSPEQRTALDDLLDTTDNGRSPLTQLKRINHSLRPQAIQENIAAMKTVSTLFFAFKPILAALALTDQAIDYFATWVKKAGLFQLQQFVDNDKRYLYLLAFIRHQMYFRHDSLMDSYLKCVRSAHNKAKSVVNDYEQEHREEMLAGVQALTSSHKTSKQLLDQITVIIKSIETADYKCKAIEKLLDEHLASGTSEQALLDQYESQLSNETKNKAYYDALEKQSLKLQNRVSGIVKVLHLDKRTSDTNIVAAVTHFQSTDGQIGQNPPMEFLDERDLNAVMSPEGFRVSLYKALLFVRLADAVKAGKVNLAYSYRFKSINDYLIDIQYWRKHRDELLRTAGLEQFADCEAVLALLKQQLEESYENVNQRYLDRENPFLSVSEKGIARVRTPATDSDDSEYISQTLNNEGFIPILQLLREVEHATGFLSHLTHHSVKSVKMVPSRETLLAGIIAKGCNIGLRKMANISQGVSERALENAVNWCFDNKNVSAANKKITSNIYKLSLANAYKREGNKLYTSSDGRKVGVAVDSLLANYSYKYFGKEKGVTMYTFIDERQTLFHSTVISASDREAAYVIDGLLQNEVEEQLIHSTDTHGFTETVFAGTHLIGAAFAPRYKRIEKQRIYGFSAKSTHEKRGHVICPSRTINRKLILKHWDDILRFMATIKLKYATASQLYKRLSSYAKDHPLYQALKEFGRILKSIYILKYYDNVELRQAVQKQLNHIEQSNRFSHAVFFARDQVFHEGEEDEQKLATACKVLIQNAIVMWNYLYLSQLILTTEDQSARKEIVSAILRGSVIAWKHVNLQGEYDFRRRAANDSRFDLDEIFSLKVK